MKKYKVYFEYPVWKTESVEVEAESKDDAEQNFYENLDSFEETMIISVHEVRE